MLNKELNLNHEMFTNDVEKKSTREGFGAGILESASANGSVVALCGDLTESLKLGDFAKKFPKRFKLF